MFNVTKVILCLVIFCSFGCLTNALSIAASPRQEDVVWELTTGVDYKGPIRQGVLDTSGRIIYLATMNRLYRVGNGMSQEVAQSPEREARIALAPDGEVYAWLIPLPKPKGFYYARLMDISGNQMAEFKQDDIPFGFSAIYLGSRGKTIVTVSPLDDWEAIKGRFLYTFWDRDGTSLRRIVSPERLSGFLSSTGETILFYSDQKATAYSSSGAELWNVQGQFRKASISKGGEVALLNFASKSGIDRLLIRRGPDAPQIVKLPAPISKIAMTPDGSRAALVCGPKRYYYLNPAEARFKEGSPLPFQATFSITGIRFLDERTLAIGVLHRTGTDKRHKWPKGSIVAIEDSGNVIFQKDFSIREATAFIPGIIARFGVDYLIGYTQDTTILGRVAR